MRSLFADFAAFHVGIHVPLLSLDRRDVRENLDEIPHSINRLECRVDQRFVEFQKSRRFGFMQRVFAVVVEGNGGSAGLREFRGG